MGLKDLRERFSEACEPIEKGDSFAEIWAKAQQDRFMEESVFSLLEDPDEQKGRLPSLFKEVNLQIEENSF